MQQTCETPEANEQQLTITQADRHIMDQNLLGTAQFAHITKLVIDGVIPSLIDGPFGLHNRLQFPPNLTHLTYTNSLMNSIPTGIPDSVIELDISGNRVQNLTGLPPNLRILTCNHNYITSLNGIPDSVTEIYCHYNPMTHINTLRRLPPTLRVLACCYCELTELPQLPVSVTRLACIGNSGLRELPELPTGLVDLVCSSCSIEELPRLPDSLTTLWCDKNQLHVLPARLPSSLKELKCELNKLTTLPELPPSLTKLVCDNNSLTMLPELPPGLELLSCKNNELTWLPELPNSLTHLDCSFNNLVVFSSVIPESLAWLDCSINPDLKWMPPLSNNMFCMRLATIDIRRTYGYSALYDVIITDKIIQDINRTHWTLQQSTATERLAIYRAELLERQVEITLSPDRISRLIRAGELGDIGTWSESLGI